MRELFEAIGVHIDPSHTILVVALLLSRTLPISLLAPFLGGELVPAQVKMGVGVSLAVVLYPAVSDTPIVPAALPFTVLLLKEVFIGTAIAIAASVAFDAARSAGTFVDTVSGANMATVFVPQIQQQASLFADLKFQLTVVIFLLLDGHHMVIGSLAESIRVVPLNDFPRFSSGMWPFAHLMMRMAADLVLISFTLAAPAAIATFMTDVAMGLINRVSPQIQVFFISMSIKPVVAVTMMLLAMTVIVDKVVDIFGSMLKWTQDVVRLLG